jgi:hypothetical protein
MASVNKASLREELATLKGQFERLCAEGKVTGETHALVQALLMLFELLMAVFMEKHTPKSSRNSSLPPSPGVRIDVVSPWEDLCEDGASLTRGLVRAGGPPVRSP